MAFRCTKRGIKAVLEKAEAPIPNPKDLPPPTKFEEDDDESVWQRGLFGRVRKAIRDMAIEDRWLLPEPPDDGLLESVEQLITTATTLRDQLRRARQSTPGESRHQQQPALESA